MPCIIIGNFYVACARPRRGRAYRGVNPSEKRAFSTMRAFFSFFLFTNSFSPRGFGRARLKKKKKNKEKGKNTAFAQNLALNGSVCRGSRVRPACPSCQSGFFYINCQPVIKQPTSHAHAALASRVFRCDLTNRSLFRDIDSILKHRVYISLRP